MGRESKKPFLIPEFGPLAGIRVISAGSIAVMPHAANMLADFAAEVVHVSGFGRPQFGGVPEVCDRASYDMMGQAAD